MTNILKYLVVLILYSSCTEKESIDTNTYFLSYIDKIPDTNLKTTDSLTEIQNKIILKSIK